VFYAACIIKSFYYYYLVFPLSKTHSKSCFHNSNFQVTEIWGASCMDFQQMGQTECAAPHAGQATSGPRFVFDPGPRHRISRFRNWKILFLVFEFSCQLEFSESEFWTFCFSFQAIPFSWNASYLSGLQILFALLTSFTCKLLFQTLKTGCCCVPTVSIQVCFYHNRYCRLLSS